MSKCQYCGVQMNTTGTIPICHNDLCPEKTKYNINMSIKPELDYQDGFSDGYSRGWRECWEHVWQELSKPEYYKQDKTP